MAREAYDAPTTDELEAMFAGVEPPMNQGELVPQQRGRDLGGGSMMVQDQVITAQVVSVPRDNAKILKGLQFAAAYAGQEVLTYRWLVRNNRTGKMDTVKGLTIKAADILLREYTNAFVDLRFTEGPVSWIYKATFVDLERGIARPAYWQEYKDTARLGAKDKGDQRLKQIPFQIGQSKAVRNVIVKYLEVPYGAYLEAEAEKNLVERVSKNIEAYRERCAKALADLGVDLVRVELQVGRKLAEWLAPDVAMIVQQIKTVRDKMASAAEQWPPPAPPEPRRGDSTDAPSSATAGTDAPKPGPAGAAATSNSSPEEAADKAPAAGSAPPPTSPEASAPRKNWRVPETVIGQDAILKALHDLLEMVGSEAELDEWEHQNSDRLAKITGLRKSSIDNARRVRREQLSKGGSDDGGDQDA